MSIELVTDPSLSFSRDRDRDEMVTIPYLEIRDREGSSIGIGDKGIDGYHPLFGIDGKGLEIEMVTIPLPTRD